MVPMTDTVISLLENDQMGECNNDDDKATDVWPSRNMADNYDDDGDDDNDGYGCGCWNLLVKVTPLCPGMDSFGDMVTG